MGRPRAFEEDAVLDAAARQFRVHGYAATSTEQLCEAAGLRRSSLYNAFVSKDELFVRALAHYIDTIRIRQTAVLNDRDLGGAERLRALIDIVIDEEEQAAQEGNAAGCMVMNSFMSPDVRRRDARVQAMLDKDLGQRLDLLASAIQAGQRDGSLSATIDPTDGALLVNATISGLRVSAQTGVDLATLRRIALIGLSALLN